MPKNKNSLGFIFLIVVTIVTLVYSCGNNVSKPNPETTSTDTSKGSKQTSQSVILTKVLPRFHVNDENKDWSTQVILKIIYQGRDVAYMECCSAARPVGIIGQLACTNDQWCENDDIPSDRHALQPFKIVENVTKEMIDNADYYVGMRSTDGHDRIKFNTFLTLQFSDGTERQWSWQDLDFNSNERDRKIVFNQFHLRQ